MMMNAIKGTYARYPVLLNSAVGYGVFASGDVMAQRLADPDLAWDHRRSLSIGLLGIVQNGVLLRVWYRALDKFVTPKTDLKSVVKKIACDEAVFAPQLAVSYLATSAYIQSPGDWGAVRENVESKVVTTWQNDLKLWPMANLIGFSLVPRAVRPLYASGVQLLWQCYLSTAGFSPPPGSEVAVATAVAAAVNQPEIA
ncbi:unnamed protein product [Scytosiphon promiscuus]